MKVRLDERGRLSPSTVSSSVAAMATMFSRVPSPVRARAAPRRAVRPGASSSRFSRFPRVAASADASPADASPRVVILGGGIQGVATAYFLAQRGVPSTIVERVEIAAAASGKAGGFLAGGWGDGGVTQELHRVSFSLHESLAETLKLETYRKIPTLSVAGGASSPDQRPPVSWLDGDVARAELMDENTAQVTPAELVRRMHEESQRVPGARTILRAEATEVLLDANDAVTGVEIRHHNDDESESNANVENAIERIECDVVVVAMGPWSCRATDWFDGLEVPMTGIKSVSLLFDASRAVAEEPAALFCAEDANACHLEVYPRSTGEVYICGCGGSEYVDETRLRPGGDLDSAARVTTDVSRVKAASASFKGLSASVGKNGPKKTQTCMRPCVTDALPVIGPVPGYEGAFINCAHNCWGILWAPASGKALAERILDGAAKTVRLEPFSPRRFFKARDAGNGRGRKMRERDVGEQW